MEDEKNGFPYSVLRMKMELMGLKPVPESVYGRFAEIGLVREMAVSVLWKVSATNSAIVEEGIPEDILFRKLFSAVVSHVLSERRQVRNEWLVEAGIGEIDIEGVDVIVNQAFDECTCIEKVNICEGVKYIGAYSFYHCENLFDVRLPDSLKGIGMSAFGGCSGLHSLEIPGGLERIGLGTFHHCLGLERILVRGGVTDDIKRLFDGSGIGYVQFLSV